MRKKSTYVDKKRQVVYNCLVRDASEKKLPHFGEKTMLRINVAQNNGLDLLNLFYGDGSL